MLLLNTFSPNTLDVHAKARTSMGSAKSITKSLHNLLNLNYLHNLLNLNYLHNLLNLNN